jgi:hypothetical protein
VILFKIERISLRTASHFFSSSLMELSSRRFGFHAFSALRKSKTGGAGG